MHIDDLETPSVLIDLSRMEANIRRMQDRCNALGLAFRPHIKTHKIPDIAKMQLEAGAIGIACQKVSEAEVFASAGITDIQIPYNIVGAKKTARLADLALYNRVSVSADHPVTVSGLSDAAKANDITIRVLVDLATEIQRTGAPVDDVIELAKKIDEDEYLYFAGLMVYPSNASIRPAVQEVIQRLHEAGIGVETVSGGGYGTLFALPIVRQLYPGIPIDVVNDSGIGINRPNDPDFNQQIIEYWNIGGFFPASCPECNVQGSSAGIINWQLQQDPNVRLGMLSYTQDSTIGTFFLGIGGPAFEAVLRPTLTDVEAANPGRMRSFVHAGTSHTFLLGLSASVEGVSVGDWVDAMIYGPAQDWQSVSE